MTAENEMPDPVRLAADYAHHAAAAEPHLKAMDRIKEQLRTIYANQYGNHAAGNLQIKISPNPRFDPDAFVAAYPVEQFPDFYKPAVARDVIDRKFPPEILSGFMKHGKPKVEIK